MKKFFFSSIMAICAATVSAQFSGNGYYRVQNYSSNRYLAVIDPSGGQRGTQVDVAAVVGYGSAYTDASGNNVKYANDAERFTRVAWDPATILYVKGVNGSSTLLDFYGQGIDTYALTSAHLTVANSSTPGTYWAYGVAYGMTLYLADNSPGRKGLADGTAITTHSNGSDDLSKWYCKPVNQNDGFYFGMKPTVSVGSDYYLSFYASFPFSFAGSGMHAYYVSQVDKTLGVAVYKEIMGNVPESTPVFVKCASAEPANNKLDLLAPSSVSELASGANLLKGTYFDCAKSFYHMHFVEYNSNTMRILGVTSNGKVGFVKKPKEELSYHAAKYYDGSGNETGNRDLYCIPANSCYLEQSGLPDELTLMTEAEYEEYKKTASSVTVKADDKSRKYGEANPELTYTVVEGSKQGGEPTLSTTATVTSPVGTYPITISKGGLTNGTVNLQNGTLTVSPAALTITPRSYTIKQNEALPTFEADYSGFKNGETADVLTANPHLTSTAPADKKPGTYKITASGAVAANYAITYGEGTLTIKEADPITITANAASMAYGDEVPQLTYTVSGGTLTGTPKVTTTATTTSDVGEYDIAIDVSGIDYPNLKTVGAKLTVTQAPVTVTAKSYTIVETDGLPTYEATYSGWKNGQNESVLTTKPALTCDVPANKTPGTYVINVAGAAAKNYSFSYTAGTLTIKQAPTITVKAAAKSMVYGDEVPELTYTVEGGTLPGTPKLSTSATKTSPVGEYDIVVNLSGISYPRLAAVNAKLTVTKAMLTVSAGTYTMKQTDQRPEFKASYSGFKNDETEDVLKKQPELATNAPADNAPGTYVVTVSGAEAQNYDFTYVAGKLVITDADAISITVEDVTMEYGDAVPEFKYTVSGGTVEGEPVITCEADSKSPVGEYVIKVEKGTVSYPNLVLTNGKLTITAAPLTIKAGEYTMSQLDPRPEFKATFEGFKNDETEAVLTKPLEFSTEAPENNEPGEYKVTVSGAEAQNYAITYVDGKLTITAADLITITVDDAEMVYGDEQPSFTYKIEGGTVEGTPAIACEASSKSDVGTYAITVTAGDIIYPQLKLVAGTLTVKPAQLTVSVGDYERFEGEENPVFELSYEGFRNDDTEEVLTAKPVATCEADADSPVGEYVISVSGGEAKNYVFTYNNGKLTVNQAEGIAAITFARPVDVFSLSGRKLRSQVTVINNLPRGVYIVNGRKVVLK